MAADTTRTDTPSQKDADLAFRKKLAEAIKKSGKSYVEVARKLGISKHLLYAYTSCKCEFGDPETKRKARCPAYLVPKICQVIGDYELLDYLSPARRKKLLRLAEGELATRKLTRELLRKQKGKAKAKKARRPFIVTGTTTRR